MVQFNTRANEILLKLVYYGPGLSGKTTNLQSLHAMGQDQSRSEMFSVNTQEDRTLFFDLLPINLGYIYGNAIHLQLYTVPGQVQYDASRRVVLGGADGVVFVADSSEAKMQENVDSLSNLYHNLNANRLNIKQIPFVIQYNKRDLPDANAVGVMNRRLNFRSVPYFEAVANRGVGVLDTFLSITRETVGYTFKKYHLDKKIKDFDEMLNLIETNLRASMHELPQQPQNEPATPPAVAESTVLRHSNVSINDLPPGKAADASELLEDALKSNMETARLYTELKTVKDALEKKNEELNQLYAQLEKANQDNVRTRKYLEGLIHSMGEALISFAPDGKILTWNAAAERIFGYNRQEIVGRNMAQLIPDHLINELDQVYQKVGRGELLRDTETTRLRKGGEAFPVRITYSPVRGADDRVLAYSALARDIGEQKALERQVVSTQKHALLTDLVPALFHEVTNALTPLMFESRLILESSMDPHQADQAARLVKSAETIQSLMDPLLLVMNPPSPLRSLGRMNNLVQEAAKLVDIQAQRLGVEIEMNLDPSLPESSLDPALIRQALANIFLHGINVTAASTTPARRLRIATRKATDRIQVVVQDTGVTISEARRADLFNPAHASNSEELALAVADTIARQHGGRMSVRSQEGLGNAFLLELPLQAHIPMNNQPMAHGGLKVLVVDDEPVLLDVVEEALASWGCLPTSCTRGEQAIRELEQSTFDFLIFDVRMPGLSGTDLYEWVAAHRPELTRRILFTTGDAFDERTQAFLESHRLPFLSKPFDLEKLRQSLDALSSATAGR